MVERDELTDVFARLSGLLFSEETLQSALDVAVQLAKDVLPEVAGAGVTLVREGKKVTAAYTDDVVKDADTLQYELDEGPCLAAWHDATSYRIDSMADETRWPRWAPAAAAMGMASSISVPLLVRGDSIGAMKVYSTHPMAYDDSHVRQLQMFAEQAAIVLANVQSYVQTQELSDHLKEALKTRQLIGQATGIVMAREGVSAEEAFAMLRQASQNANVKLRDIAKNLVEGATQRRE